MDTGYAKGLRARVASRNGKVIEGTLGNWDYNPCTFEKEYDLHYMKDGNVWTLIGIPEDRIEVL